MSVLGDQRARVVFDLDAPVINEDGEEWHFRVTVLDGKVVIDQGGGGSL